ncbi:alcohol dehydrogenase catalytic domain-containing protein [Agrococcus sp. SGAir0287]|uniref:alcohol dehydrogenase catalytic domain-containing protein n=1 Tax=Agrococcus sp. SGAir0287 TaxID=2070347 RepID=UPI0010CD2515|nr:zinc-binding dehydrogenase [Agrococcus sp. SGAir0287]QCR20873.1 NADPH:quinone reductase [Agrococcus sp. SGAir0287]
MRAAMIDRYGAPEVLRLRQAPIPDVPVGAIRIRATAASVNPLDWKIRDGSIQQHLPLELPVVLGRDAAGVVEAVGEGVHDVAVGDRVFGLGTAIGAYAELVVLHAWARTPDAWTDAEAAAMSLTGVTAARGLRELGAIDDVLVVHGAGGGVGSAAASIAIAQGARVVGTARPADHEHLRSLGVDPIAAGPDAADAVRAAIGDADPQVLDTVGDESVDPLVALTRGGDRAVTVVSQVQAERLGIRSADGQNDVAALELLARLATEADLRPRIAREYPLADAAAAHRDAEERRLRGKAVLRIAD